MSFFFSARNNPTPKRTLEMIHSWEQIGPMTLISGFPRQMCSVFVHTHVHVLWGSICMCRCVCMYAHLSGGQPQVSSSGAPPTSLRQSPSSSARNLPVRLVSLASEAQGCSGLRLFSPGVTSACPHACHFHVLWGSHSIITLVKASVLPSEPSAQPSGSSSFLQQHLLNTYCVANTVLSYWS